MDEFALLRAAFRGENEAKPETSTENAPAGIVGPANTKEYIECSPVSITQNQHDKFSEELVKLGRRIEKEKEIKSGYVHPFLNIFDYLTDSLMDHLRKHPEFWRQNFCHDSLQDRSAVAIRDGYPLGPK